MALGMDRRDPVRGFSAVLSALVLGEIPLECLRGDLRVSVYACCPFSVELDL